MALIDFGNLRHFLSRLLEKINSMNQVNQQAIEVRVKTEDLEKALENAITQLGGTLPKK